MNCTKCGQLINPKRLEILPNTTTCVNCSDVQAYRGFEVYPHKTGGTVYIVDPNALNGREALRQADRAYRRSR